MFNIGRGLAKGLLSLLYHIREYHKQLITRRIRGKSSPHCGAKQREKYGTSGRYNFAKPTFKNKA